MPTVSSRSARFQQLAQTVQAGVAAQAAANALKLDLQGQQPSSSSKQAKPVDSFGGNLNVYPGTKTALLQFDGAKGVMGSVGDWSRPDSTEAASFSLDAALWGFDYNASAGKTQTFDKARASLRAAGATPSFVTDDGTDRRSERWTFPDGSSVLLLQMVAQYDSYYRQYRGTTDPEVRVLMHDAQKQSFNLHHDDDVFHAPISRVKNTAGNTLATTTLSPNTWKDQLAAQGFTPTSDRYFTHPDGSWALVAPSRNGLRVAVGHMEDRIKVTAAPSSERAIPAQIARLVKVSAPATDVDLHLMAEQLEALDPEMLNLLERAGYSINVTRHRISNADASLKNKSIATSSSTAVPADRAEGVHQSGRGQLPSITVRTYMKEGQLRVDVSTLLHEIGHAFDMVIGEDGARGSPISTRGLASKDRINVHPDFVAAFTAEHQRLPSYFHTQPEFFAEAFALFMLDPARCQRQLPQTYMFLEDRFDALKPDDLSLLDLELKFDRPAVANVSGGDIAKQLAFTAQRNRALSDDGMPTQPVVAFLEGKLDFGALDVAIDAAAQVRASFGKEAGVYRNDENLVIVTPEVFNDAAKLTAIVDEIELSGRAALLYVADASKITKDSAGFGVLNQVVLDGRDVPPLLLGGDGKSLEAVEGAVPGALKLKGKLEPLTSTQQATLVARFAQQEGMIVGDDVIAAIEKQLRGGGIGGAMAAWAAVKGAQFQRQLNDGARLSAADFRTITVADVASMKLEQKKSAVERMNDMVGQDGAKRVLDTVAKQAKVSALREAAGLPDPGKPRLNLLFSGAPGTGKTTFAEILGALLQEVGAIKNPTVTKVTIQDLIDGKPEVIVKELFENNKGGVIFIDEMHQLKDSAEGRAAYKAMIPYLGHPDHADTVFIGAGYNDELGELIRNVDAGGERRFTTVPFIDYDKPALSEIMDRKAASLGMTLDASAKDAALAFLDYRKRVTKNFGNAGEIDVALGHAQKAQTLRIADLPANKITVDVLRAITAADFSIPAPISKDAFWKQLDAMSGWDEVKTLLKEKAAAIEGAVKRGKAPTDAVEPYWIVDGPPGTGKSTLARLLASFGAAYGLTATPEVIDVQGANFQGEFVGQTAGVVTKQFEKAWGRLMFVDEVSGLARSGGEFKYEAAKIILAQTENHRGKFMMVVADYAENINQFLKLDPGLARRFGNRITLSPWSPKQATDDLLKKLKDDGVEVKGLEPKIMKGFEQLSKVPGYASGGDVRTLKTEIIALLDASSEHDTTKTLPRFVERAFASVIDKKQKDAGIAATTPTSTAKVATATATAVQTETKPKLEVGLSAKDKTTIAAIDKVNQLHAAKLNGLTPAELEKAQKDPKGAYLKSLAKELGVSVADALKTMTTVQVKVKKLVEKREVTQRFVYHCPYCGGIESASCGYINQPMDWKIQHSLKKPWDEVTTTMQEVEVLEERQVGG